METLAIGIQGSRLLRNVNHTVEHGMDAVSIFAWVEEESNGIQIHAGASEDEEHISKKRGRIAF